jgi:hypothetical protein
MVYFPFAALLVISVIYRSDLGLKALVSYWSIWAAGLLVIIVFSISPGFFVAIQAVLAVAMLIQLRVNPQL